MGKEKEIKNLRKEIYKENLACSKCDSKNTYTNLNGSKVCRKCGYKEKPTKQKKNQAIRSLAG